MEKKGFSSNQHSVRALPFARGFKKLELERVPWVLVDNVVITKQYQG